MTITLAVILNRILALQTPINDYMKTSESHVGPAAAWHSVGLHDQISSVVHVEYKNTCYPIYQAAIVSLARLHKRT